VIAGCLAGAAVDVVVGELPKLTGTDAGGDNVWRELTSWLQSVSDVHATTLLVAAASLAVILGVDCRGPSCPTSHWSATTTRRSRSRRRRCC
jgi:SulP family sulfate permease